MIEALVTVVVYLCVLALLYWLAMYVLDNLPLPDPIGKVARILVMVLLVISVIYLLLSLVGHGSSMRMDFSALPPLSLAA